MKRLLALVLLLQTSAAVADVTPADRAVEIGHAGLDAYSAGDWRAAYEHFERANQLAHSPVFVLYMARCQRNAGELLNARELLRTVTRRTVDPTAPLPWQTAIAAAHAELGLLQQSIPTVWIRRARQGPAPTSVVLDGRTLDIADDGEEVELDPGEHSIEYRDRSGALRKQSFRLSDGQRRVPVLLESEAVTVRPRAVAPTLAPAGATAPGAMDVRHTLGWTALGVGAAGVGLGMVSGLIAKRHRDELDCTRCDEADKPKYEIASDWAALSTVSFIFSGTALLCGAALVLIPPTITPAARVGMTWRGAF